MAAGYVQAIRTIRAYRDTVWPLIDDHPANTPETLANCHGQIWAYDQAIQAIHDAYNPGVDYDPALYFDVPQVPGLSGQQARGRVGQEARLDYPLSPYHGKSGLIVDTMTMQDGQVVLTVEWPDGIHVSYTPDRLRFGDNARAVS